MAEKILHYANFNITFGDKEAPMLTQFSNLIFPAFVSDYTRRKKEEFPVYSLNDLEIKSINGEYILAGNYIKETEYNVLTVVEAGELVSAPERVPTAPYSRFIIFLKNHRMILVRNEVLSPDIRSFQATVRTILNAYIREYNKGRQKEERLPNATVNIVDMPLKEDIDKLLKEIDKIRWLKLRFFPLNNDFSTIPFLRDFQNQMIELGSKAGNAEFRSPDSKSKVGDVLKNTSGLAVTRMEVVGYDGEVKRVQQDTFSSAKKITMGRDIQPEDDDYLVSVASNNEAIRLTSKENENLYNELLHTIENLLES